LSGKSAHTHVSQEKQTLGQFLHILSPSRKEVKKDINKKEKSTFYQKLLDYEKPSRSDLMQSRNVTPRGLEEAQSKLKLEMAEGKLNEEEGFNRE
jgi:hypothetical protein